MTDFKKLPGRFFADGDIFTAFDTETTGLKPEWERIVEIGAVRFDRNGIIARFSVLIHPGKPMPPNVTAINGITDDMLAAQPRIDAVIPDFLHFIKDSVLVAHNAGFDTAFVNTELERCGMKKLRAGIVDTVNLTRFAFPGLPNYKLQSLASRFGIPVHSAHRAEDDARVCMELFFRCVRKVGEIP